MRVQIFLIFCAFFYPKSEVSAETAICQYAKSDVFIFYTKNPGYSCEFALNTKTFESVTEIDGDHERRKADGDVNILQSYSSSKMREFSSIFCQKFPNLAAIKIEDLKIKTIDDDSLQNCPNLRLLHVERNEIREIPENLLSENTELLEIQINSNQLESLYQDTFEMQENLKKLFLNNNKITTLPSGIFKSLKNLERLHLDENRIETLDPEWFKKLTKLEKLSLNSNKIYDLPKGVFATLNKLILLEVNSNHLTAIYADSFGTHRSLFNVHLSFNDINGIDSNFIQNNPISVLLMEDNKCFQGNVTRRDLMDDDLEKCFENFNAGRVPRPTSSTTTTSTTTTTTTTPTTTTTTTTAPKPTTTSTTTTTTTTTPKTTTTSTTTTQISTSTITTTKRTITRRPMPSMEEYSTRKPTPTGIVLPKDKYGKPHPMVQVPDISSSKFERGAYPWIAGVLKNRDYHCGGVLVSNRKVVTAAGCMYQKYQGQNQEMIPRDLMVVLGSHSIYERFETGKTTLPVFRIRIHPDFDINAATIDADVAVLILTEDVHFIMYVRPIILMDLNPDSVTVTDGVVASYGQAGSMKSGSNVTPRQIRTEIYENEECSIPSSKASDRNFCGKSDICTKDIGSGLFIKYYDYFYLRGIVSAVGGTNNGVCDQNSYTVFTDISKFSKWIGDTTIDEKDQDYE